jgi:serine/threonine protein kinase/tetratricopeptide (TPR) repeat protein
MAAVDAISPGAVIDQRYELLSHLGTGGFGLVYKAKQLNTGQLVAIKIARHFEGPGTGGAVARFQREMSVVAQLGHPNIVRLIDAGQLPDGRLFTVLQLVHGITLDALFLREGPMRPPEAQHLMTQVLDALCSAHDLGVIHRDLKPANIMVTNMGARRNAMVLDFGIATYVKSVRDEGYQSLTPDGSVGGTPAYMAPEQLHGQESNPQSDIYAWGLVFLECLTGQRVVRGGTMAQNMFIHLRPEPHVVPPVIAAHPLGRMLRKALAKDPAQRYIDARSALNELLPCDVTRLPRMPRSEQPPGTGKTPLMSTANPDQSRSGLPTHMEVEPTEQWSASYQPHMNEVTSVQPRRHRDSANSSQNVVAERRQLTTLACEIGPLAALSESLGPDELYELLGQFRELVEQAIAGLEGTVERVDGGRVVSYFGFPIAHEDDASRAAQAALEICRQVRLAQWKIPEVLGRVDVHVGIHAGLVVTSSVHMGEDVSIVGDVSRIAVLLQDNAEPGSILVSEAVHRLLRDRFECEAAGTRHLGAMGPAPVYRVLGTADTANRATAATPSVGRENELATLIDRWEEASDGRGQVVLVTGEIGIGKSHLTSTFRRHISSSKHVWLDCVSSPYLSGSALHPLIHAFHGLFQIDRDDPPAVGRRKIGKSLAVSGIDLPGMEDLLIALLALDEATTNAPAPREIFRQRQSIEEQLIELFLALAERSPLVLRFEDLHWADPSTQELVRLLVDQVPLGSIYLLPITRPSYTPDWQSRSHVTRVQLSRLSRRRAEAMVRAISGDRAIPDELVAHLAAKTDGVPLFVEELTKAVLESPAVIMREDRYDLAGDLGSLALPDGLRGSLMARLDRLGPAKEVAQIASVIGREFSFALLAAICDQQPRELQAALDQIVHAELAIQRGRPPHAKYVFKHGLIQDTAYESLLEKTRRHYHGRIADALASRFLDIVQAQPELVAHHYTEGRSPKAQDYWLRAGMRAAERSANLESIQHLTRGLELLAREPATPERDERELTFTMRLGAPLMAIKGYGAEVVEQNFSRALALCRRIGDDARELVPSLWGLWLFHQVRARYGNALEVGAKLLALAEEQAEPELYLCAHQALGSSRFLTGAMAEARGHFEAGIAIYDTDAHHHMAVIFAQDPNVFCRVYLSRIDCAQGFPDRARAGAEASIAAARALAHPHSLAFALCMTLPVYMVREEHAYVEQLSAEAMDLCTEHRLGHWLAFARFMHGAAWAHRDPDQGIATMQAGLAELRAAGSHASRPYFHALLALHIGRTGHVDEALAVLHEVPPTNHEGSEHLSESTWQRTHAKLLLRRDTPGDRAQAESLLEEAADGAHQRGDRLEEVAALTLLTTLRCSVRGVELSEDPCAPTRARLHQLLDELEEGHDLPLLRAARRSLDSSG